ncbi:MAG: hypothetical protein JSS98_05705 [Bacteroidetes bacterium]|nr:hypothetical protein [Bacteroidota bacterium]
MFALLIHIYYHESWEKIFREQLYSLKDYSPLIMINLCLDIPGSKDLTRTIKNDFPEALITTTPNKGKDIGGKLALINLFLDTRQAADYIVFLHDKISPHSITGDQWRTTLFSIINQKNITGILKEFTNNKKAGILGAKNFIKNEYDTKKEAWETTNSEKLEEMISMYHLKVTDHTFVAGTMFWVRSSIIRNFFTKFSPLDCRKLLEEGDPTDQYEGTYTHSWERILCWLANDQQYSIKGI